MNTTQRARGSEDIRTLAQWTGHHISLRVRFQSASTIASTASQRHTSRCMDRGRCACVYMYMHGRRSAADVHVRTPQCERGTDSKAASVGTSGRPQRSAVRATVPGGRFPPPRPSWLLDLGSRPHVLAPSMCSCSGGQPGAREDHRAVLCCVSALHR
jgi:hypothetical protein